MPLSVAASSMGPSALSTTAQSIVTPAPPLIHALGVMPPAIRHRREKAQARVPGPNRRLVRDNPCAGPN